MKIKLIDIFEIILISSIFIFTIFPYAQKIEIKPLLVYNIFFIFWLFLFFIKDSYKFIKQPVYNYFVYLFLLLLFIVPYSLGSNTITHRYLILSPIFYSFVVTKYYLTNNKIYILKIVLYIIAFFSLLTSFTTISNLIKNPFISRIVKSYGYEREYVISKNIGGYEFVYYSVLIFPILFYYLLNFYDKISKKNLFLLITGISFIILTVILSNYFIALTILFISVLFVLIFKFSKKNTTIKLFFLLIFIITIYLNIEKIFDFFIDRMSSLNKIRLQELKYSYIENRGIYIETRRWELYKVSFTTFLEYPILGAMGKDKDLIFDPNLTSGQHSHFMDSLVYLGLFLSLFQLYIIFRPFYFYYKEKKMNDLIFIFLFSFIIIFLFNNLTPSMAIPLYLLFPYMYDKMVKLKCYEEN